jgi:hypothetical protein
VAGYLKAGAAPTDIYFADLAMVYHDFDLGEIMRKLADQFGDSGYGLVGLITSLSDHYDAIFELD